MPQCGVEAHGVSTNVGTQEVKSSTFESVVLVVKQVYGRVKAIKC